MGRSKQIFPQRRHTEGQKHMKQHHQLLEKHKSKLQSNVVSLHTNQNGHHQKVYKQQMLESTEKREPALYYRWECKLIQSLQKTVWRFLKKLKLELLQDPAIPIPLLGTCLEKTIIKRDTCIPMFTAAIFTSQDMEATVCPSTAEWIKKMGYIYIAYMYNGILLSHKKNEIMPSAATCMGPGISC